MFNKEELIADIQSGMSVDDAGRKQGVTGRVAQHIYAPTLLAEVDEANSRQRSEKEKIAFIRFYNEFGGEAAGVRYGITHLTAQTYACMYRQDTGFTEKMACGPKKGVFKWWSPEKKENLVKDFDEITALRKALCKKYEVNGWATLQTYVSKFRLGRKL